MSIWLIILFAVSMLTGVAAFAGEERVAAIALPLFVVLIVVFLAGVFHSGIRRPVV